MFFVTGDIHSDPRRFTSDDFPIGKELTKEDYVIICGDFGLLWSKEESEYESYWLDWLEKKPWTTLFVDGNHENFDRLYSLPVEEWNGGKIHRVRPSVIHLMRGQLFDIDGTTFFAFGGARSHDIQGGVLERDDPEFKTKAKRNSDSRIPYRINHESWWKEEMPSIEERMEGWKNMEYIRNVDFIISHDCPTSILGCLDYGFCLYTPDELNDFFEEVNQNFGFRKWYFGHYHLNQDITNKFTCLYSGIDLIRDKDAFRF